MRSGASEAFGWPTTRSWTTLRAEYEALREDGISAEWVDELSAPAGRDLPRRDPAPGRRVASACPLGATARRSSGRGRSRDRRGDASRVARRRRRRAHRDRHRRLHERPAAGARPDDQAGPRPGDRHRAAGGDAVSAAALRAPRLRLLAANPGSQARPRRPARQEPRRGVHERGGAHRADPGRARGLRGRARRRRAAHRAPLAGDLRLDRGPPPAGGPGARPRRSLGLSRLFGPRQRHGPRLRRARGAGDPRFACARARSTSILRGCSSREAV